MASRYWVGGTADWDGTAGTKWATSSGGTGGASVPDQNDNVFFDANSGVVTVTVTLAQAPALSIDCTGFTGNLDGSAVLWVYGSLTLSTGMAITHTGGFEFKATTTGHTVTTNGKSLSGSVQFNGVGGEWTLGDALQTSADVIVTAGTFDLSTNNYSLTADQLISLGSSTRAINLRGSTVTLSSPFSNAVDFDSPASGLTLTAGTSQINATGVAANFNGGGHTFYNVTFTTDQSTNKTHFLAGANTFNNLTSTPPFFTTALTPFSIAADQTITGTFSCAGSTIRRRQLIGSSVLGTPRTLTVGTLACDNSDFQDIVIAGTAAGTSLVGAGDRQGNSGITFPAPATLYWNLAGTQNWSATGWSNVSGGSPSSVYFPLAQDTAVFNNSGAAGTVTADRVWAVGELDMSARSTSMSFSVGSGINVYKDLKGSSSVSYSTSTSFYLYLAGRSSQTIFSNGCTFGFGLEIVGFNGNVSLGDGFSSTQNFRLTRGTFNKGSFNMTTASFGSTNSNTRTLNLGSGSWIITGNFFDCTTGTNLTVTGGPIILRMVRGTNPSVFKSFLGGGKDWPIILVNSNNGASSGTMRIAGENSINEITNDFSPTRIIFSPSNVHLVSQFSVNGTAGNLVTIDSNIAGTAFTITKGSGVVSANYLSIKDSSATGGALWYAANSVNVSNNTGWVFSAPPATTDSGAAVLLFQP